MCPSKPELSTSEPSPVGAEIARKGTQLAGKDSVVLRPREQSSTQQLREESLDPSPGSSEQPRQHGFSLNPELPS